jgi:hypothetical protein
MTVCSDCPAPADPPIGEAPIRPFGANCCLKVRYTCVLTLGYSTWVLDAVNTACVDNAGCAALLMTCTDTEYTLEQQNGCVCFALPALPAPFCAPSCGGPVDPGTYPVPTCTSVTIYGISGGTSPVGDFQYTPPAFTPAPSAYNWTNELPPGCSFNDTTGAITGGCTTPGSYTTRIYAGTTPVGNYIEILWIIDDVSAPTNTTPFCYTWWSATFDTGTCTWGAATVVGQGYGIDSDPKNEWLPTSTPCEARYIATDTPTPTYGFAFYGSGCGTLDNGIPCVQIAASDVAASFPTGITGCSC